MSLPKGVQLTWVGVGGLQLVGWRYVPPSAPRAVIALAHGINDYSGRYLHIVSALLDVGISVYVIDHRGHGQSAGPRALIDRFDDLVDDFELLTNQAKLEQPDRPFYVLGHSMGGLIATRYALRHQAEMSGLILSGPALVIDEHVAAWTKKVLLGLARVAPRLAVMPERKGLLSRDPEVDRRKNADPLGGHQRTRLGSARSLLIAGEETRARLGELTLPLLVMHGGDDVLTFPSGSRMLVDQASCADKTLKIWPGLRHEIFNEPEGPEVITYMIDWLEARLPR
jgi:acylglycerol lipase